MYTWLYNGTGRSLLFVSVFYAMSNTVAFAFVSSYGLVVAAVIVLACGPRRFRRAAKTVDFPQPRWYNMSGGAVNPSRSVRFVVSINGGFSASHAPRGIFAGVRP
ncbi:MAG: hypothetical protein ACPL7R_08125 [Anaerolineae bacterium]